MVGSLLSLKISRLWLCLIIVTPAIPGKVCLAAPQAPSPSAADLSRSKQPQPLTQAEPSEYFEEIYRDFYNNYRLGPADEIAVRVVGQPDYSLDRMKISPLGRVYHPLVGDIEVAGLTVEQLTRRLAADFGEYLLNPRVSVELVAAQSAKIGVLGEVVHPGIVVMTEPMTVLGAVTASGGVADSGNKTEVTLLRQTNDGRLRTVTINLKRILAGKADPDENLTLRAGDTLIVSSNVRKKISNIAGLGGFTQFLAFITLAGR